MDTPSHLQLFLSCLNQLRQSLSLKEYSDKIFRLISEPIGLKRFELVSYTPAGHLAIRDYSDPHSGVFPSVEGNQYVDLPSGQPSPWFWHPGDPIPNAHVLLGSFPCGFLPVFVLHQVWGAVWVEKADKDDAWTQQEIDFLKGIVSLMEFGLELGQFSLDHSTNHLQALSRRLVQVQEAERRQIARELHDEATQSLSSLLVGLKLLEKSCGNPEEIQQQIQGLRLKTADIMNNLHHLAVGLRPPALDHLGLVPAIEQLVYETNRDGDLEVQFELVGEIRPDLDPQVKTAIYRITQEALANISRHAQATRADILLEARQNKLLVVIEDNGIGFDPALALTSGRLGLIGMRERAEAFGGHLLIESHPGQGTTLFAEVRT